MIGKKVTVKIDRPMGSYHPKHKDIFYPINYGYIEGIMVPDGEDFSCDSGLYFVELQDDEQPGLQYFILDENNHYSSMDMSIATEPFELVAKPHSKRVEGFPLDSLSIDIATGKYYYDLDVNEVSTSVEEGKLYLYDFVRT